MFFPIQVKEESCMLSSGAHMILFFIFRFLIHLGFILVYDVCDLVLCFPNG